MSSPIEDDTNIAGITTSRSASNARMSFATLGSFPYVRITYANAIGTATISALIQTARPRNNRFHVSAAMTAADDHPLRTAATIPRQVLEHGAEVVVR